MKAVTLAKLAVAGSRTDVLRSVLTAVSTAMAVLALLGAETVRAVSGEAGRYASPLLADSEYRPAVIITLLLMALPALALAGQCIRLGTPARDRRLAALRLAGATPGETMLIAVAETAIAALLGSALGLAAYAVGRVLLDRRDRSGQLLLPTDVRPSVLIFLFFLLAVPMLATAVGALLMHRAVATPLGVVRRTRAHGPRPWPGLLIVGGSVLAGVVLTYWNQHHPGLHDAAKNILIGLAVIAVLGGIVLGTGWISYALGGLLRRYGRGPSMMLAGQRMTVDPWQGSRTLAALLAAVLVGAIALGYRSSVITTFQAWTLYDGGSPGSMPASEELDFSLGTIRLAMILVAISCALAAAGLLVALAESIAARRRTYAAMTASGVPRRTLSAAILWQMLIPSAPALLLTLGAGTLLARLVRSRVVLGGGTACSGGDDVVCVSTPLIVLDVPVPYGSLVLLGGGALLAVLLAAGAGLLVLRSGTDLEELRAG